MEPRAARQAPSGEQGAQLARLYRLGVTVGIAGLAAGLLVPALLWVGVGSLVLVPLASAVRVALDARRTNDPALVRAILASGAGLLVAVLVGLLRR